MMISHYQPPHGQREYKESEATSSSQSFNSALKDPTVKQKLRDLSRYAQQKRGRSQVFSPSDSEVSDGSEQREIVVVHKRAPPEPPTHADQLAVQSKHIDAEVERAMKLLDVRKQLVAYSPSAASNENLVASLNELARLLELDRKVIHPECEHLFTSDPTSFVTPTARRQRSNCSYETAHCETANTTCEDCDKFVCDRCARKLCVRKLGNNEEDFHFCKEHVGNAPTYDNQPPQENTFTFEPSAEPSLEDAPHVCDWCKLDIRQPHEPTSYVLGCAFPAYAGHGEDRGVACIRHVCDVCSKKLHPYRHDQDSESVRGFHCKKHCSPILHVLDEVIFCLSVPMESWDQRNPELIQA
jgi:hypothetical protein